jgi:hypothetical protein
MTDIAAAQVCTSMYGGVKQILYQTISKDQICNRNIRFSNA